ncbi:MAG: hypothetical protein GX022_03460 [Clostridiaceae bacterium]|nr:hypothetical protein [Clostridiaceae bacterium]
MDNYYFMKQDDMTFPRDETILSDSVKIKHVNRLKNRKARYTANKYYTLGRGRNFKVVFESIVGR